MLVLFHLLVEAIDFHLSSTKKYQTVPPPDSAIAKASNQLLSLLDRQLSLNTIYTPLLSDQKLFHSIRSFKKFIHLQLQMTQLSYNLIPSNSQPSPICNHPSTHPYTTQLPNETLLINDLPSTLNQQPP